MPLFKGREEVCRYKIYELQKRYGLNKMRFGEINTEWSNVFPLYYIYLLQQFVPDTGHGLELFTGV